MRAGPLALLACACASTVGYTRAERPCQEQAVDVIWRQTYHRTDPPPQIWWVPLAAQNCGRPTATGARGFIDAQGLCVGGNAWRDGVNVVWYGDWRLLAHEFEHVAQARDGLPPDSAHTTAPFQSGGLVERATAALAAMTCAP